MTYKKYYKNFRQIRLYVCLFAAVLISAVLSSAGVKAKTSDFEVKNGVLIKYTGSDSKVIVPDTVVSIGKGAFRSNSKLVSITLPDSVTSIGDWAFAYCNNLKEVTLSGKLTKIGKWSFCDCFNIESINIPALVKAIGSSAFSGCRGLNKITIPDLVTVLNDGVFSGCSGLKSIKLSEKLTSIGNRTFGQCSSLTDVKIPASVTKLGESAFAECSSLRTINLPDKLTSIGKQAFLNCSSLTKAVIPVGVESINEYTFFQCTGLVEVTVPDTVTVIGQYAFYQCPSLKTFNIPEHLTTIGTYAFAECSGLADFNFPETVQEIGVGAFDNTAWFLSKTKDNPLLIVNGKVFDACKCTGIVTVPEGVTEIGARAFQNSSVTEVILPEGVTKLGDYAFAVRSLKKITLPESLMEIGTNAFFRTRLSSIIIPGGVIAVGDRAFFGCDQLKTAVISEGVQSLGQGAFAACTRLNIISLPKSLITIESFAFQYDNGLYHIEINPDNPVFSAENYFLLSKDKLTLLQCARSEGNITVPEGVEAAADGAFQENNAVTVTFPDSMKKLSNNLFYMCDELVSISIPSSLVEFGEQKFEYCKKLKEIAVFEAKDQVNFTSKQGALYNADQTALICDPVSGNAVVSGQVISIGNYAFPNADISVTIPTNVTVLGDKLFNEDMLWKPADEEPFCVYGYMGSAIEDYCKKKNFVFLAYDGTYSITYQLNEGTNSQKNPSVFTYNSAEILLYNPTKAGYAFLYWYEDISICEDGCCRGERIVSSIPQKSLGDIHLIAKWEKVTVNKAEIKDIKKLDYTKLKLTLQSAEDPTGYEIVYAVNSAFTSGRISVTSAASGVVLDKLVKDKTYYIKVRAYKLDSTGNKIFGSYSTVKKIKL